MGIFDKLRDLFTDEEEIIEDKEIDVEEMEEHKLPTFMREKIEREEREKQAKIEKEEKQKQRLQLEPEKELITERIIPEKKIDIVSDRELVDNNKSRFRFPISFEEQDYKPATANNQNIIKKEKEKKEEKPKPVKELYAGKKEKKEEKPKFRATPIISPVYGILDKNYKKEEVKAKDEAYEIPRSSTVKNVDFETVRKKAFGNLSDEIKDTLMCEKCELYNHFKEVTKVEKLKEDDILYDITQDDLTIDQASENYYDFGVSYENSHVHPIEKTQEIKIVNHNDEIVQAEKIEVKETIKFDTSKQTREKVEVPEEKNLELTDDLFNLIDSMYADKEEDN